MQKLSDLVNEKYKTDKTIVGKENSLPKTKLEENLLTAILKPLGIYFVFTFLGNLLIKMGDYMDGGVDTAIIKAQRQIVKNVGGKEIANLINTAYESGASAAKLAKIYVNNSETQKEINKFKSDKRVIEAGGIQELENQLLKTMTNAYADDSLEQKTVKDLQNKLN
jgi:hypothetical protein